MDWAAAMQKCRSVKVGFFGHPTWVSPGPPASPAAVESVDHLVNFDFVPEEYLSFLRVADGAFLLPWDRDESAGVELFSVSALGPAHELAEDTATGDDPRYFVVRQLRSAASDFIAVDAGGAVWWLAQGAGPGDWAKGYGIRKISGSLIDFVDKLADAGGAWWWLRGFEAANPESRLV